jgi:hypothetical protein
VSVFSPGKDGEAGDVGSIVDTAGCSQAENKPLEARSSSPTGSQSCGRAKTMDTIGIALIGSGYIAHYHARALLEQSGIRIKALCSLDGPDAQEFAQKYKIPEVTDTVADLLGRQLLLLYLPTFLAFFLQIVPALCRVHGAV